MNNLHTVENQNGFDFVLIQFDRNVRLTGANLDTYTVAGSFDNDATLSTGIVNAPWNSTLSLHTNSALMTALVSNAVSVKNSPGTPDARTFSYNQTGNIWILGADHMNTDGVDGFKLKSITFSPAVPEPATWAMMIGGFGAVGMAARRRANRRTALTA
ncbi:PEPxxWA-CTERM sorting domain-containing protein [Sphingomonas changnyeongensis]|uniref:PEPxxWA-CTERM sorting domain-containing protein n=2 Tax=Sphingomonas changnyeongensis TaxID=2698679 RepID=A0A7Z2NYZ4_9SPHN|nr:PEPxxWA-CTERM sorting domain-containing protein [Sphingomonas changnyeongensis]